MERDDHIVVLNVLTKADIQKLANRTNAIRGEYSPFAGSFSQGQPANLECVRADERYYEDRAERRAARRRDRHLDRNDHDEYDDDSENEFKPRAAKLLGAPTTADASGGTEQLADVARESKDRRHDREGSYASGAASSSRRD